MTGKQIKEALRSGESVFGTMIVSTSPRWLDVIGQLGLDFVFIDTEHIAIDREKLSWMCHAYAGKGITPIVRIPSPDPYKACMTLDGGASGIVAPYIETVKEVRQLHGAVKCRPIKGKKLEDFLEGQREFEPELLEYLEKHNEDNLLIVNIESRAALDNLDEIIKVPGLDAVLIGPHDLSCNLGIPEQYDHPRFKSAVGDIITRARNAGIGAGIHVFYNDAVQNHLEWAKKGANLILHSGDINRFAQAMNQDIEQLRNAIGSEQAKSSVKVNI
jgi:4-hydroxy-2-oxoheptanedioate aldolase